MVDSPKGSAMADRIDNLTKRVEQLEDNVKTIATSLQDLSASVMAGFVEQREYTELAFQHLEAKVVAVEGRLEAKIDSGLARVEAKVDSGLARVETKIDSGLGRIERKLDQFIDVQSQTNRLTDLRLRTLER